MGVTSSESCLINSAILQYGESASRWLEAKTATATLPFFFPRTGRVALDSLDSGDGFVALGVALA